MPIWIRKFDKEEIKRFVPVNEWGFLRQNLNKSSNITTIDFVYSSFEEIFDLISHFDYPGCKIYSWK